ncbi:RIP metalloprotease RseP [bacterium (Candidatus Torokbacteria) CG_4_10_14_0_2_um_filter_35_8]|nr:MAG: RIP metalloprotease RseP [bacterium (Candidatus Torokbacteria) CG_4_10_14_0_2_um_filter_35_8]
MLITIITFIIILSILILAHEIGHFFVAKKMGMKIEEFGLGYPPRVYGVKKGGVVYSLNLIPFGGFVKILGEENEDKAKEDPRSFQNRPWSARALTISAGVLMNFALAVVLLSIGFNIGIPAILDEKVLAETSTRIKNKEVIISYVNKGSPAEKVGLQVRDTIIAIDGEKANNISEIIEKIKERQGAEISLEIKRRKTNLTKKITPRTDPPEGEGALGVGLAKIGIVSYPWYLALWKGAEATFFTFLAILTGFWQLIKGVFIPQAVPLEVAGPVGIAVLTGRAIDQGWIYVLQLTAILSINLGIINFFPIPALDGGRFFFLLLEKIRKGKKVNVNLETLAHQVGFYALIILLAFVTFRDIFKWKEKFWNAIERIVGG